MRSVSRQSDADGEARGFILVAVLWLLAGLATMATVVAVYTAQSAVALSSLDDGPKWEMMNSAAVELAAHYLSGRPMQRPTRGSFTFSLGGSSTRAEFVTESARININMAPRSLLSGLFTTLGEPTESAEQAANRVVAWRTSPMSNRVDEEAAYYRTAGVQTAPRRAPFNSIDELWLVAGLSTRLIESALPFITIYSGTANVNVLEAPGEVIAALPGMSAARRDAFVSDRARLPRNDPKFVLGALGDKQVGATMLAGDAYRIRVRTRLVNSRERTAEIVILLLGAAEREAYRVLSWRDDIEPIL